MFCIRQLGGLVKVSYTLLLINLEINAVNSL